MRLDVVVDFARSALAFTGNEHIPFELISAFALERHLDLVWLTDGRATPAVTDDCRVSCEEMCEKL